jgi:hypothetical protein
MNARHLIKGLVVAAALAVCASPSLAEPTHITVHVIAKGAKFIGTTMGGVRITIRDADTGELLAKGMTAGGTGDTKRIMAGKRPVATPDAAKFDATIDIDAPRRIEVTAYGPLARRNTANTVSSVQWVVPGKDITAGDGWLLEMPGFFVDVQEPVMHEFLRGAPQTVPLKANVRMMCGCPIEPGGLWNADQFEVTALIRRNGQPAGTAKLSYAGKTSEFAGTLKVDKPGTYEATIYAYDPKTGNTGLDRTTFIVTPK